MKTTCEEYQSKVDDKTFLVQKYKNEEGLLHREDGPAWSEYWPNGQLFFEYWLINGKYHRDGDLPAITVWHEDGTKYKESWLTKGEYHREGDLPVIRVWRPSGELRVEMYNSLGKEPRFVYS